MTWNQPVCAYIIGPWRLRTCTKIIAEPTLYDELVRKWQTGQERTEAVKTKSTTEILEAGFERAESRRTAALRGEMSENSRKLKVADEIESELGLDGWVE